MSTGDLVSRVKASTSTRAKKDIRFPMSEGETETGITSSEGVVVFRDGDDVDKVVKGTKNLIIHGSVKEVPDGAICTSFFPYETIEELIIEEGVKVIGRWAFKRCENLKCISFPSSLEKIDEEAFKECSSLIEVDLSHTNIMSIGWSVFSRCKNLKRIIFPTSLEEIGYEAFFKCYGLIEVDLSHTNLTNINEYSFYECNNLKSISFPTSLEKIGLYAFQDCSRLIEVDISHTNVTSIDEGAFWECKNLSKESIIEIEKVYKRIYESSKQEYGEDHNDTQSIKRQLAEFQKEHGRYLNEDTQRNLENLHGFIKSRDNINKVAK